MGRQVGRSAGGPGPPLAPLGALAALPVVAALHSAPQSSPGQTKTTATLTPSAGIGNANGPPGYPGPHEGLPAKFVQSMKTLFDILDEKGSGLVPLRDIESRWARQANTQVIEHLRAVADQNHNQLLSFDRFCLALKMSLLADSPKSSCSNSVSSVTSASSPAPPASVGGPPAPSNATTRGPVTQKGATAPGAGLNQSSAPTTYDNEFDHRRQGSNSSTAGSLDSPRFVSAIPPPPPPLPNSIATTTTLPSSQVASAGSSRLPKFASNGSQSQPNDELQAKSVGDSGPVNVRAASVPPSAGEPFTRQENDSVGRVVTTTSQGDAGKLNSSFENLLDIVSGSRGCASRTTRILPPPNAQGQSQHPQKSMLLPPSVVRPPAVNAQNVNVGNNNSSASSNNINNKSISRPGANRQPPPQVGHQQKPGPPPGPSPASANLRRIVRPPSGTAEPHRLLNSVGSTAGAPGGAPSGTSGRSRTPDNCLENSSGHQRAIKPPMMRSVSSIAESQLQKHQTPHGPPEYNSSQHTGLPGLAAIRKGFPLPGLAAAGVPVPKSVSIGPIGLQLGPPLAPPPARRSHSVLHEVTSTGSSSGQGQTQHHVQAPSSGAVHSHTQGLHNAGNVQASTIGCPDHQQHQPAQQTSGISPPAPSSTSVMANMGAAVGNSKVRDGGGASHLPQSPGGAMLAPIQSEPVLTANKVILGPGPNKVPSTKTPSQIRLSSGVSHYGHIQTPQQQPPQHTPPINSAASAHSGTHHRSSQVGFLRGPVTQRDLSAMVRAIPCQTATANVQQVQSLKQTPSPAQDQHQQQPQQQQTQFAVQPAQQVPLRQMCLPPGGLKPEKPPRRREPRRHTLAHGIEYGMIRRLKLLEEEREVLQKGLQAVERARDWYLRQIGIVQDKLQATSHGHANPEYSIDTHEERLRLQMARVVDVNHHLAALVESGDKASFPLHMNLALLSINSFSNINYSQFQRQQSSAHQQVANVTEIKRLREHNAKLSSELENRQGVIKQLETEKAQLLRELFATKAQQAQVQAQVQAHSQRFRGQQNAQTVPGTSLM